MNVVVGGWLWISGIGFDPRFLPRRGRIGEQRPGPGRTLRIFATQRRRRRHAAAAKNGDNRGFLRRFPVMRDVAAERWIRRVFVTLPGIEWGRIDAGSGQSGFPVLFLA